MCVCVCMCDLYMYVLCKTRFNKLWGNSVELRDWARGGIKIRIIRDIRSFFSFFLSCLKDLTEKNGYTYICIYFNICTCMCVYLYIYTYTYVIYIYIYINIEILWKRRYAAINIYIFFFKSKGWVVSGGTDNSITRSIYACAFLPFLAFLHITVRVSFALNNTVLISFSTFTTRPCSFASH